MQLLTWTVFFFNFGCYYAIDVVTFSDNVGLTIFLSAQYLLVSLVVLYYAVLATQADPSDPTIRLQKETEARG